MIGYEALSLLHTSGRLLESVIQAFHLGYRSQRLRIDYTFASLGVFGIELGAVWIVFVESRESGLSTCAYCGDHWGILNHR